MDFFKPRKNLELVIAAKKPGWAVTVLGQIKSATTLKVRAEKIALWERFSGKKWEEPK